MDEMIHDACVLNGIVLPEQGLSQSDLLFSRKLVAEIDTSQGYLRGVYEYALILAPFYGAPTPSEVSKDGRRCN